METVNELHLPNFEIVNKRTLEDGTYIYDVTPLEDESCCTECGCTHIVKNGTRDRQVRDLPVYDHPVVLEVLGNRYMCRDCGVTFVPNYDGIDPKSKITVRLRQYIEKRCLTDTLTRLSRETGVSPTTVSRITDAYIDGLEAEAVRYSPRVLGIDEAHLNKEMRCVYVDIENKGLIDIREKRDKKSVIKYLDSLPNNDKIEVVTMDMWRPYREAVYECLPGAKVVIDHFHVIQVLTNALDAERKTISSSLEKNPRVGLKNLRHLLLHNAEDLSRDDKKKLDTLLTAYPDLELPYRLKEAFRTIYTANTRVEAEAGYEAWKALIPKELKSFQDAIKTIENWKTEIFNFFDYRYSNGVVEATNNLIKSIEKQGRGYSFRVIRARMLYGTSATKMPRYVVVKKPTNKGLAKYGFASFNALDDIIGKKELVTGSMADIFELNNILRTTDFKL